MIAVVTELAKSGNTHDVPLNDERSAFSKRGGLRRHPDRYLFPGPGSARLTDVKTALRPVVRVAGVTCFRFSRICGHHVPSRLVITGVDLNTVRELLDHADLKMTLRYAHLAPEQKVGAARGSRDMSPRGSGVDLPPGPAKFR
jgi:site-specific recombinase XerD